MKRISHIFLVGLMAFCALGNRGCQTDSIVVVEGPKATELGVEKDKQIAGLVAQVKAEQEARELERAQAALAAANFEGILFAAEHVPTGLPRNAIEEEAKLGKERSPPANPQEVIKAKDRVIAILQNEVEKAKALYGKAFDEAAQAKALIATKDQEIAKRDAELMARQATLSKLAQEAADERVKHKDDVTRLLKQKDDELKAKDQAWFLRVWGVASLACVFAGILAIALTQGRMLLQGGILVAGGGVSILARLWYVTLIAAPWFPYLAGLVVLVILGAGGWALYRIWKTNVLHAKTTAALQDLRDEAVTKGTDDWTKTEEHLKYRLGNKSSYWAKEQLKTVAELGLVNPKAETSSPSVR